MLDYILQVNVISKKIGFGQCKEMHKNAKSIFSKIMKILANELEKEKLTKTWSIDH